MNLDVELIRQFLLAHAETLLAWLAAGLAMLQLARFELRRAVRRATQAMAESVATTVAACVPDIAHAVRGDEGNGAAAPVEAQRAEALRRVALDTVATVMARERWLGDLGNLRLPDEALLAGRRGAGADPLLVVAPQPVVQAYLAAQRVFEEEAAALQAMRREAQALQDSVQALAGEAERIDQETAAIVLRFEQANAQAAGADGGDYQRLLIQKYNALGLREKEVAQQRGRCRQQAHNSAETLARRAVEGARRYGWELLPLMEQLRAAWGHGDTPAVFDTWLGEPPAVPPTSPSTSPSAASSARGDAAA
ncbi:hypothetical protein BKK79_08285 [Cupriavidus sp. USMAA2-4]|uniref:hypothetical protein n=1 Tax=Cupriavidus sp. USMAA2-4 TaxID=876364 RepID=UPI0008A675E2|nr:hypothetical protein [Cupriavidus sp. USMAA2-4]AOY91798.1 hypothetical protein BKK79_08285 [Cupriavidus sp. USMAA2-4]